MRSTTVAPDDRMHNASAPRHHCGTVPGVPSAGVSENGREMVNYLRGLCCRVEGSDCHELQGWETL